MGSEDQEGDPGEMKTFEDVLERVGTTGKFNIIVIIACASVGFMTPMQVLSAGFLGKTPQHWCHVEELVQANWTTDQIRAFANPENQSCVALDYNYTNAASMGYDAAMSNTAAVGGGDKNWTCTKRDFDEGVYSIVSEWDLVCDRLSIYSTTIAAPQGGLFIGSIFFGYLLDRIGRRLGLFISICFFVPCGLAVAASMNVYIYMIFRVFVTMFGFGMYLGGFVLSMELCTPSQRSLVSSYFVMPWAIGYMNTAVIAYFFTYWRYLQLALTLPSILLFINFFIIHESPRWLNQRGRHQDALRELKKMAERNQRTLPSDKQMLEILTRINPTVEDSDAPFSLGSWSRKWIVPQLQPRTPIVFFCWFSVAMVYYGVSQGASNLGINEYAFIFVGGVLEILSYIFLWPGIKYLGRRTCVVLSFLVAAGSLFGVMGMQMSGHDGTNPGLVFLSYAGKFMITASFHLIYIITGELFSTSLRSLMIGESSVCARFGSILSPFINVLLGKDTKWAPAAFFASFSLLAGLLALLLPETKDAGLDDDLATEDSPLKNGNKTSEHATNAAFELAEGSNATKRRT